MTKDIQIECTEMSVIFPLFDKVSRSLRGQLLPASNDHRARRSFTALDNVSVNIYSGDRVGLLGKNGAGKSTFLRVLAGVYIPNLGKINVNGKVSSLFEVGVGMDPNASGYDNIPLLMSSRRIPHSKLDEVQKDVEEFTELGDALLRPVRTYSAGMRLRIAFAVSTFFSSEVLLMDEVMGVGDKSFRDKAKIRIEGMMKSAGTLILASHAANNLRNYCDKGIVFDNGRIIFEGSIDEAINVAHST